MIRVTIKSVRIIRDALQANQELWRGDGRRALLVKWVLCVALLCQFAFCPKLWFGERSFPTVPVFPGSPQLPIFYGNVWFVSLVIGLLWVAVAPRPRWAVIAAMLLALLLVCFDINRLQPWFYEYMVLLMTVVFADNEMATAGFVLAALYVWSGLQKFNQGFATVVFPWLGDGYVRSAWFLAPTIEVLIGVCLLIPRLRTVGLIGAFAMHGTLLGRLIGLNTNSVIWPWNFWMPILALAVFKGNPSVTFPALVRSGYSKVLFALVGAMPALNFAGWWDDYLSASLYSGRAKEGYIFLTPAGEKVVPASMQPYLIHRSDRNGFDIILWSTKELNVPPYPEIRAYRGLAQKLVEQGIPEPEMSLVVSDRLSVGETAPKYRLEPIR